MTIEGNTRTAMKLSKKRPGIQGVKPTACHGGPGRTVTWHSPVRTHGKWGRAIVCFTSRPFTHATCPPRGWAPSVSLSVFESSKNPQNKTKPKPTPLSLSPLSRFLHFTPSHPLSLPLSLPLFSVLRHGRLFITLTLSLCLRFNSLLSPSLSLQDLVFSAIFFFSVCGAENLGLFLFRCDFLRSFVLRASVGSFRSLFLPHYFCVRKFLIFRFGRVF